MAHVHKRAAAKRDLVEHYVYLAESAGLETAERFLLRADESSSNLAKHPAMGVELALSRADMAGIRKWQAKGLAKFLDLRASAMKMAVPKAPWIAAARRRLGMKNTDDEDPGNGSNHLASRPRRKAKAAPDRRNPRRFAHLHLHWWAESSWESAVRFCTGSRRQKPGCSLKAAGLESEPCAAASSSELQAPM